METIPPSQITGPAVDVCHVSMTSLPTPTNTATPTTTFAHTDTAAPATCKTTECLNHTSDTQHVTVPPTPVQVQMEVKLTTDTVPPTSIEQDNINQLNKGKDKGTREVGEQEGEGAEYRREQQEESAQG